MGQGLRMGMVVGGVGVIDRISPEGSARVARRLFSTPRARVPSATERALLARGRDYRVGGLATTAWGDGPPVLLVHGWQRHRASLGAFVAPLVARGYRAVAFDAPAHNDSPGRRTNPLEYGRAILAVARDLGPLAGLIGHSMGAGASVYALHEGLEAERAVLLAGAADWEHQMRVFAGALRLSGVATDRFIGLIEERAGRSVGSLDTALLARGLDQPALLFHDPDDPRVPYRDSAAVATNWRGAVLIPVPGLGHSGLLGDPKVIEQSAAFVAADWGAL